MARWRGDMIGKKLQHVGSVEAANEREALAEAIKYFAIRPALRSKIVVTKTQRTAETKAPTEAGAESG